MFCGYCGKQNLEDHCYCVKCGCRLESWTEKNSDSIKDEPPAPKIPDVKMPNPETQKIYLHSFEFDFPSEGIDLKKYIEDLEKEILLKALNKTGWVKNRAAMLLSINRTTLVEKLKKYGIKNEHNPDNSHMRKE